MLPMALKVLDSFFFTFAGSVYPDLPVQWSVVRAADGIYRVRGQRGFSLCGPHGTRGMQAETWQLAGG